MGVEVARGKCCGGCLKQKKSAAGDEDHLAAL
jgi:hypothetical protein